jgi:hypothetical protein
VTGSLVAVLNLVLPLGAALLAILVMGFLGGDAMRPMLLFDAHWIVVFAALTPLSAVALDVLAPGHEGSADGFDVLVWRVQVVSLASLALTVIYLWGGSPKPFPRAARGRGVEYARRGCGLVRVHHNDPRTRLDVGSGELVGPAGYSSGQGS